MQRIRRASTRRFVSWRKYNTNLADAAQIVANSIRLKLYTAAPSGEDAIAWINDPRNPDGLYATDHTGQMACAPSFGSYKTHLRHETNR